MKKRMIAMLLCVLMALSSMGGAVFAAEEPVPVEEPIAEETVPPVDEFEVVDPHPLEGTVTEEIPEETEVPEIVEPLPTEEPSAAEPPAEEETEPEATEPAEDSMSSGILDMDEEVIVQMPVPSITVTPGMTEEELIALVKSQPKIEYINESFAEASDTAMLASVQTSSVSSTQYSESYSEGMFYANLMALTLGNGQLSDFVQIALSQDGYFNCPTSTDLSGENQIDSNTINNSEYGRYFGLTSYAWNAMFVSWCARMAGISTSIIPHNTVTNEGAFGSTRTDFSNVQKGDIVYILGSDGYRRIGIVYDVDSDTIYTIEGQRGDYGQVGPEEYDISGDSRLQSYTSPNYLDSWDYINGGWYFRAANGSMKTGWFSRSGYCYYLDPNNGGRIVTGWKQIDGTWYYFRPEANDNGPQGSRVSGWVSSGSYWYYMDPNFNGAMATGWRSIYSNGKTGYYSAKYYDYYFDANGHMLTGWQSVGADWYYLRPADNANGPQGSMATGWIPSGSFWYYTDPENDGAMVIGWKDIDGERYYFSPETASYGQMVTGWQEIDGIWYHFDIYDSLGALNTGWYETSAGRYYLDPDTGAMTIGWRTIEGVQYYFDENGRVVE